MSNLYRSALSARIAKLPADLGPAEDGVDEETDSLGSLPGSGMGPPAMQVSHFHPHYFGLSFAIEGLPYTAFQVALPGRNLDSRVYYTPPGEAQKGASQTVMILQHGAGYSGLSFACMAKEITDLSRGECGVLAIDARRHGRTASTSETPDEDLSIGVLVDDFVDVIQTIYGDIEGSPTLILVGHSMGGSIVTRACPKLLDKKYKIGGVAVLDVVEGSAIEALPHMNNLLNARPDGFDSVEEAVEWHVTTKAIRNPTSARISIPNIVKPSESSSLNVPPFVWRTTLRSTAPYWESWFLGLSSSFLSVRTARLLVLAGTDRLDKELMIGQMQGKFQMIVVPGTGHMLHEDDPTRLAEIMVDFWRRNERLVVGIKKVGEK
ncbi:hypothetical protein D9757_010328 [Collybiopsis confluens]|uniref:Protein phosphatase methylesterase 1 n=1 Tax=Collybiopsis confluens TaxID=2823264 RepID=A0A8H5LSG1_9AGAR|nr:hypothetical protein D9757_010328 [Collybiopsis confluens]